jgi:hypothetical protein
MSQTTHETEAPVSLLPNVNSYRNSRQRYCQSHTGYRYAMIGHPGAATDMSTVVHRSAVSWPRGNLIVRTAFRVYDPARDQPPNFESWWIHER